MEQIQHTSPTTRLVGKKAIRKAFCDDYEKLKTYDLVADAWFVSNAKNPAWKQRRTRSVVNVTGGIVMEIKKQRTDFVKKFRNWIIFTFRFFDCERICWAKAVMWAEFHENYLFSDIWTGKMDVDKDCLDGNEICYCGKINREEVNG